MFEAGKIWFALVCVVFIGLCHYVFWPLSDDEIIKRVKKSPYPECVSGKVAGILKLGQISLYEFHRAIDSCFDENKPDKPIIKELKEIAENKEV